MLELMYTNQIFQNFRIWCDDMPTAVPVYCLCLGFIPANPCPPPLPLPGGGGGLLFKFNPLCVMIVNTGRTV